MTFNISSISSSISSITPESVLSDVSKAIDPSNARLSITNLLKGGEKKLGSPGNAGGKAKGEIELREETQTRFAKSSMGGEDWRIRVKCPAFGAGASVIFPVLPQVTITYTANYSSQALTHSNYKSFFYDSSEVSAIQLAGDFPIQNVAEGQILLKNINFFKATTKMFFGTGTNAGNPPPIVFLNGYGKQYFPNVPCVVTSFQHTMPNDVDYINCNGVRLPTFSQLQVSLQPVISRSKAGKFNLNTFAKGGMMGFI